MYVQLHLIVLQFLLFSVTECGINSNKSFFFFHISPAVYDLNGGKKKKRSVSEFMYFFIQKHIYVYEKDSDRELERAREREGRKMSLLWYG